MESYIQYIIIIALLVIIAIAITRASRKDAKIEVNKLVDFLGGKNNIISYEANKSRFMVTLKDISLVNKEVVPLPQSNTTLIFLSPIFILSLIKLL